MKTYYNILQHIACTPDVIYPKSDHFEDTMEYWNQINKNEQSQQTIMLYTYILTTFRESVIPSPSKRSSTTCLEKFIKIKHQKIAEHLDTSRASWIRSNYIQFLEILTLTQKHYNAFAKLANIYRYKKQSAIENDLLLNPIIPKSPNAIEIYDINSNSKFVFTLNDLISHIDTALSNTSNYFCEPLEIRNPYNNIVFKKSTLYNIYYKLKSSSFLMPVLYHYYFLCDFDIKMFALKYEEAIRDSYIQRMLYKTDEHTMMKHIRSMVKNLTKYDKQIHQDIDKTECIRVLRPYFYLYIISRFHIHGLTIKWRAQKLLIRRINELFYFNPKFGRIYIRTINGKRRKVSDLLHPEFTMNMCKKDSRSKSYHTVV